jgi:ubiquinone/menaquinone biosynthesis C-methylase UbiE
MLSQHNQNITFQFDTRSSTFERSAHWIVDQNLARAHADMAGVPGGKAIEMCCGTGMVSRALKAAGWDVTGVDISPGMVREAQKFVPAMVGDVSHLPFADHTIDLIAMRQAYFLLDDGPSVLKEVRRLLKPQGTFVLSHLVPFSQVDESYLREVHTVKQAQMKKFFTTELLKKELEDNGFHVTGTRFVVVRESVSLWMEQAPELSQQTRQKVCDMVATAPAEYKKLRNVEVRDGQNGREILEDWNFVLISATPA